jgi:hypothetical protein
MYLMKPLLQRFANLPRSVVARSSVYTSEDHRALPRCVGQDRTNAPNRINYDNFRRSMCAFFPCKADACTMQLHRPQIKSIYNNTSQGTSLCTSMIRTCVNEQGPTFGFCSVRGPSLCEKMAKARGLSVPGIRFQKHFNFF